MPRPTFTPAGSTLAAPAKRWGNAVQIIAVAWFLISLAVYYHYTHLWNVVCDSAEMHYILFLMSRGHVPYVQISDINMPGIYLVEMTAVAIFGHGDVAWRFYEYLLMTVLGGAGMAIAGRARWAAGLLAAGVFMLMHAAAGPYVSTERDEIITILLACSLALLCMAVRRRQPIFVAGFGFLMALACSIKPPYVLADIALCAVALVVLKRQRRSARPYVLWAVAGHLLTMAIVAGFLAHYHAFQALYYDLHTVLPSYAGLQRMGLRDLVLNLWPGRLALPASLAVVVLFLLRCRMDWEDTAILLLAGIGALVFVMQGKGYIYHRYIFAFFLILWIANISVSALTGARGSMLVRLGGAAILLALGLAQVHYYRGLRKIVRGDHYTDSRGVYDVHLARQLDDDLNQLGGHALDGKVFCLETAGSCLNALYRLQLDETLSYTGDLLLFYERAIPAEVTFRQRVLDAQAAHPADVMILSNEWFRESHFNERSFHKIDTWPEFRDQLEKQYVAVVRRQGTLPGDTSAYKLLVRRGSPAAALAAAHPLGPVITDPLDSDP